MKNLLDTKASSLQDILGNGKLYQIPDFQRDYSWEEENWEDLWNDFLFTEEYGTPHYMGTIVLQSTQRDDQFIVVDGQQRLTTMTIVAVAIMKILDNWQKEGIETENNKERFEEIQRTYIGKKTISGLHYESKLQLNKNNNHFFQDKILTLKDPINYSKLKDSEKLLYDAFKYFYGKLSNKFKDDKGEKLGTFLESVIAKKLIFIQIVVDDDLSAYTVFETLNARGVELTTTDLLKNYFFAICAKSSEITVLEETWNNIVHQVGLKDFPVFLRYYLNAKQKLVRKEQLFKAIKHNIKTVDEVFNLLDELEKKAHLYTAIKNPFDDFWNEHNEKKEIQKSLTELKLFGVSQPIPLLFASYEKTPTLFAVILKATTIISFRYNTICQKNPNEIERVYNNVAEKISNNTLKNKKDILASLKSIYVNDEDFKNIFTKKEVSSGGKNKTLIKYMLTKIENQISETDNDWREANFTIEHILPENFTEDWDIIFDNNAEKFIYRLGNYTLLEENKNHKCSNKPFTKKKEIYKTSKYKLTREYLNKEDWDINAINHHQEKLAKLASSVWKISF